MSIKSDIYKNMLHNLVLEEIRTDLKNGASGDSISTIQTAIRKYIDDNFNDPEALSKLLNEEDETPKEKLDSLKKGGVEFGPSGVEQAVYDVAMPVLGDVAKGVGTGYSLRNAMLSNALKNMAATSASNTQKKIYGPTAADLAAAVAGPGLEYKGAVSKMVGDLVSNRLEKTAEKLKNNADKERILKFETTVSPHGEMYRTYNRLSNQGAQ